MALRVDRRSGGLTLTVPAGVSQRRALAWAATQEEWAREAVSAVPPRERLEPGGSVVLFGRPHLVDWAENRPRRVCIDDGRIVCGGPAVGLEARLLRWMRAEAVALLDRETREMAGSLGVSVGRVGVGDPGSRWGSCSARGDIRYSWRLILAPDFVRRSTVAHEVAHLVHMDHSPRFHAVVDRLVGADAPAAREWLRREGGSLMRIG